MMEVTKGEDKGGNDRLGDEHSKNEEALLHHLTRTRENTKLIF